MQFTSIGFTQDTGCRVFAYEGIGEDRVGIRFTVRANLAMSRQYGIRLQELPLMCLGILERSVEADRAAGAEPPNIQRSLIFSEEAMSRHADECVAAREAAALKRSSVLRPRPKTATEPTEFRSFGQAG